MDKLLKAVGGLILLYILLVGGSGLAIRGLLSTSFGERVRQQLQENLPVKASISGGDFDLAEWFFLKPAISFQDLRIDNPPGFSSEPLLRADRVAARAELSSLFGDEVRFHTLEITAPVLRIESGKAGRTNVQALLSAFEKQKAPPETPAQDGGGRKFAITSFNLVDGRIIYAAPGEPDLNVENVTVAVDDFSTDVAFRLSAQFDVFKEEAVHMSFEGTTGPFTPRSSPTEGTFQLEGRLGLLPVAFRKAYLGALLADPGSESRLTLKAKLNGDLLGVLTGTGDLSIGDVMLGDPARGQLPLDGEAPMLLTLVDPMAAPSFQVTMPDASLQLGSGRWQGGVEVQYDGSGVHGKSTGAVTGVKVNQMLSAFTAAKDELFGEMTVKRYDLSFSGSDADHIVKSLNGSGRIDLTNGKLAAFDAVATIEQHLDKVLGGNQAASGATTFVRFGTDFEIRNERIYMPDLLLENDAARIGGAGSLGFDQSLDFDLSSLISGPLATTLGGRPNAEGVIQAAVPLDVSGTLSDPKVLPDLKRLAVQTAVDQAKGLLEGLLKKKGEESEKTEEDTRPRLPFNLGDLLKTNKD